MRLVAFRAVAAALLIIGLNACGSSEPPQNLQLKAESALPPGQSGFFSNDGQAAGSASGEPGDYGAHVDDQRLLYWNFDAKPGLLGTKPGTPVSPKSGVEIYRDSYGVPIVYADNALDLWFGVGYAVAQDRLFLMDAVRRTGAGTLAELTGCGDVPADIQQRTVTYSDAEYQQLFDGLSQDSKDFIQGYVNGANAWLTEVTADPSLLPAEYTLLSTTPAAFTVKDVLAAGVYITRFVAAEGGNEFQNIRMLKELETEYGSRAEALKAFQDMVWLEDSKATTSVPSGSGEFSNQAMPGAGREAVFNQMANWALELPETIWKGDGTGHAAAVGPCAAPSASAGANNSFSMTKSRTQLKDVTGTPAAASASAAPSPGTPMLAQAGDNRKLKAPARSVTRRNTKQAPALAQQVRKLVQALHPFRGLSAGHSFALAIGPQRTRDHGTLLISAPQLGYSYPLLLVEYEIHGAGYHARGTSVPILPTVGIGYSDHLAWGLTTGYSKTIDSFIETICSTAQQGASTCAANQYFHNGVWKDMDCRTETINYRARDPNGVPFGPPNLSTTTQICRTVHGPIVARDDAAGLARSLQYAMFKRELETIDGVREWNRAQSFDAFVEGVKKVTWNENVTVATKDGHIGFFHPGLFPRRSPNTDMRLPSPGTGAYDFGGNLAFSELPKAIDPPEGYVANWNTKPTQGWLDGEGLGSTSRSAGPGQRVTNILDLLDTRNNWTFDSLRDVDIHAGTTDPRAREFLPVIADFRASANPRLNAVQKAALDQVLAWDRKHYGPDIDLANEAATDGPAATIFGEFVIALRDELFGSLKDNILDGPVTQNCGRPDVPQSVYNRVAGVGSHLFDQSVMDNLVVRILNPASSGLAVRRDYTGGRTRDVVMLAALNTALTRLAAQFNGGTAFANAADLDQCRRVHPRSYIRSLTGVIGPGSDTAPETSCVTMPYQDRGSWVHRVGYEAP